MHIVLKKSVLIGSSSFVKFFHTRNGGGKRSPNYGDFPSVITEREINRVALDAADDVRCNGLK